MLPNTSDRIAENTAPEINRRIAAGTRGRVIACARHPEAIERRLVELDREWDIERAIEANAAIVSMIGVALGALRSRRWFVLPGVVAGFLFQHATQGWCPPVPVLRRLGFRTAREIETERLALKMLRGDFAAPNEGSPEVRAERACAAAVA